VKRGFWTALGIGAILIVGFLVIRQWQAPEEGTPEHSLAQLAAAARLGLWPVADEYIDRPALRQDVLRAMHRLQAADWPCPRCPSGTLLAPYCKWVATAVPQLMPMIGPMLEELCKGMSDSRVVVTRSADDQTAEAVWKSKTGATLRLQMRRIDTRRWRVVGWPNPQDVFEPGYRRAQQAQERTP
jgi:hypothetical protein